MKVCDNCLEPVQAELYTIEIPATDISTPAQIELCDPCTAGLVDRDWAGLKARKRVPATRTRAKANGKAKEKTEAML